MGREVRHSMALLGCISLEEMEKNIYYYLLLSKGIVL